MNKQYIDTHERSLGLYYIRIYSQIQTHTTRKECNSGGCIQVTTCSIVHLYKGSDYRGSTIIRSLRYELPRLSVLAAYHLDCLTHCGSWLLARCHSIYVGRFFNGGFFHSLKNFKALDLYAYAIEEGNLLYRNHSVSQTSQKEWR